MKLKVNQNINPRSIIPNDTAPNIAPNLATPTDGISVVLAATVVGAGVEDVPGAVQQEVCDGLNLHAFTNSGIEQ